MTFLELYGNELDRELGTADRAQRFTTARRKAAINAAQLEWVKRTECFILETPVTLVDDTQDYDLESTISDFGWISKRGVSIKIVSGSNTRYIEGKDLTVTTVERLNDEEPGWRAVAAGTPRKVYVKRDGGALKLGLHPKPNITGSDVWTAILPYVVIPADLSADADEPFTLTTPLKSMRPWHRALVYYAAFDLEKFRKDVQRSGVMLQLWEAEIVRFVGVEKPKGGQMVRVSRDYRSESARGSLMRRTDPRT